MKIVITDDAVADLDRLQQFLAEKDTDASERAKSTLIDAIDSLMIFPERGRPSVIPGLRELIVPFGQSGYVVQYSYRALANAVYVFRIRHGREDWF